MLLKALEWAKERDYAGYDPFDALSSPVLRRAACGNREMNILFTQCIKRCPVNLREAVGIVPSRNPKAIALFAQAYDSIYRYTGEKAHREERDILVRWLKDDMIQEGSTVCWGYNFPWQSRRSFLSEGDGCSVVTFFVAESLMDLGIREHMVSVADFYLERLNILHETGDHLCLSYTPHETDERVVNSNALLGYQLARIGVATGKKHYIEKGQKIIDWVISKQQKNGGWIYSPNSHLGMDNFHNGYVLWALMKYSEILRDESVIHSISKAFKFYEGMFSRGRPIYSTSREYPADIHDCAQGIITFNTGRKQSFYDGDLHREILRWTLNNMWDDEAHYFYYQKHRHRVDKTPFMRWSQAWMCNALGKSLFERGACD